MPKEAENDEDPRRRQRRGKKPERGTRNLYVSISWRARVRRDSHPWRSESGPARRGHLPVKGTSIEPHGGRRFENVSPLSEMRPSRSSPRSFVPLPFLSLSRSLGHAFPQHSRLVPFALRRATIPANRVVTRKSSKTFVEIKKTQTTPKNPHISFFLLITLDFELKVSPESNHRLFLLNFQAKQLFDVHAKSRF